MTEAFKVLGVLALPVGFVLVEPLQGHKLEDILNEGSVWKLLRFAIIGWISILVVEAIGCS